VRLGRASKRTLSLLITDVENYGRAMPRTLRSLLVDLYREPLLEGQPDGTELWLYVGTDGFSLARLKTGNVFTVQRLDLPRYADRGRSAGAIDAALLLLAEAHRRRTRLNNIFLTASTTATTTARLVLA
jgi:hypothetical protein